ncbi:hypothetical protein AF332_14800 [Sporosarcina globispora]|uniref:Uncharacterized protein n=1 Tax=Sporosarcina globispora TaxID=1459 RepID=A0A0M0GDZ2_SPOGL|nr:hypothetical protein [Sporosarcina globispora]KON87968.1 hypothetical protein AF332_14800 [Sporosarcina globispora]
MVDRMLIKNYFTRKFPIAALVIALIGLLVISGSPVFGLIILAIGSAWMAFAFFLKKTATDHQVDEALSQDLSKLVKKGLDKFGLLEEEVNLIKPIIVNGPSYVYVNKDTILHFKRGKDDEIRYSLVKGVIFFFNENQVYSYTCVFDLLTGNHFTETTDEYFYKDIVSVATKSERIKYESSSFNVKEGVAHDVESFTLTTSGGTSISAYIRDNTIMEEQKGNMDVTDIEEKIKAMRNLLREKKAV